MLVPKKNRIAVYSYLFKGAYCVLLVASFACESRPLCARQIALCLPATRPSAVQLLLRVLIPAASVRAHDHHRAVKPQLH